MCKTMKKEEIQGPKWRQNGYTIVIHFQKVIVIIIDTF